MIMMDVFRGAFLTAGVGGWEWECTVEGLEMTN